MPTAAPPRIKDSYLQLVSRFPLRRLKSESQRRAALRFLTQISLRYRSTRDAGILDYLDMLAHMIDQYEQSVRLKLDTSHRTPAEIVRHLIDANGLTISGLAKEIGIGQSNLSEMLSGRREFSKTAIGRLCERLGISPALFF